MPRPALVSLAFVAALACSGQASAAESAESIYTRALAQERQLRASAGEATLAQFRAAVRTYELVVRRFPRSGYCDNALWQAANLALFAFERFGDPDDRKTAIRLLVRLKGQYPSSSFATRASQLVREIETGRSEPAAPQIAAPPAGEIFLPAPLPIDGRDLLQAVETAGPRRVVTIRDIKRSTLPDGVRVTIEMDGESFFRSELLEKPRRVFFDFKGTRTAGPLQDAVLRFTDDIVREIRLGRHPNQTTRVVLDMDAAESYSTFTLYNPFRLVIDFKRAAAAPVAAARLDESSSKPPASPAPDLKAIPAGKDSVPLISRPVTSPLVSPAAPDANSNGQFSLARQLGLGISRIVLDAGHGGHDPGAKANGLTEAELVLDVTLRLRALLEKEPGIEVTLTRDSDAFIALEERTAIANRNGADLFLSIHANASRNGRARGVETYFLNFATNPEAAAVAARENSGSARTMHHLPDILRAIALNNKIDESRDFAETVQKSMVRRLAARSSGVRDLGVKQAPFVVLIGAGMPSVLAEISFVTNKQEAALLRTSAYRQQIAEALCEAVLRYQRSLKGVRAIAARD